MERRRGQATGLARGELRCMCVWREGGATVFKGKFMVTAGSG